MSKYITELANDIAKSCPDLVENGCGNDNCVACLAFKLTGLSYQKQEWISIDDRLPEEREFVIVFAEDGLVGEAWHRAEGLFWWVDDRDGIAAVTHWMPLPEPPKKGGAE